MLYATDIIHVYMGNTSLQLKHKMFIKLDPIGYIYHLAFVIDDDH